METFMQNIEAILTIVSLQVGILYGLIKIYGKMNSASEDIILLREDNTLLKEDIVLLKNEIHYNSAKIEAVNKAVEKKIGNGYSTYYQTFLKEEKDEKQLTGGIRL